MADEATNRGAFRIQQHYCAHNAAPIYAAINAALAEGLTRETRTGARVLDWPGEPTRDAVPLRLIGGLHALVLAGAAPALAEVFAGRVTDPAAIGAVLADTLRDHDEALYPWLDGPPQTNEPGRSGALMAGLLAVAARFGPRLEILEIGSSAGLNLLIDRYRIDLGGTVVGPADAGVTIVPDWRGPPPPAVDLRIESVRGCDVAPMDATDPAVERRLAAYIWAEAPERLARVRGAIAMLRERPVDLVAADAADWVEARLAEPQAEGMVRVLMHSVVWQYLPEPVAERIRVAMAAAGARADAARPLAWVAMEPDRSLGHQAIRVRGWPGDTGWQVIATAHAHAAWIDADSPSATGEGIALPDGAQVRV
ncbi:MAG: DUF2332 domain-containing protein [Sphingomonas taxi]